MSRKLIEFPGRPRVKVGAVLHEEIAPARLDAVIRDLRAWIYSHGRAGPDGRTLTAEQRHRLYARSVAAAAVNALLDDAAAPAEPGPPPVMIPAPDR